MEGNRDEFDEAKYAQDGRMMSMDQLEQLDAVDGVDQLDEAVDAFANVGQGLEGDSRTEMLNYWQQAIDEIEHIAEDGTGHECFKSTALPLARIKKVMKTDSEVRMISAEAPILFAKGCDIFITELTMRAWIHAEENKRRTLQRSDIATAIQKSDVFDFLIDIVPREEAQQRKASHHRAPHSEGGNISNDPHTSQHPAGRQPREMHYVGDSRSVNAPQMHNMPMGSGGPYVPPPPGQAPNGIPGGSSMPEGGLPPQQFAQFDARFAQFPQQFAGAVPAPPLPQFGQFAPQFAGGQYIPPPGVPASLASPHQIPSDVRQSPPTRPLDAARPDALGAQINAQALRAPPEPERRESPHAPPPPQTQPQEQPERPPQESQEPRAPPQPQAAAAPPPPPGQSQAPSQAASPSQAPGQSQGQSQGQGQATSQAADANPAATQAASPAQAQAQAQGAGASPQMSKAPARYDAEFQYAPAYGETVDVAFGPSY